MHTVLRHSGIAVVVTALLATFAMPASADEGFKASLSGGLEVPPVDTKASGTAKFVVKKNGAISGKVQTKGIKAVAAHIHDGAPGVNGGVAITLNQKGDDGWVVPKDSKLSSEQMAALKAGNLYVNVHSTAHPGGEIRGQLRRGD